LPEPAGSTSLMQILPAFSSLHKPSNILRLFIVQLDLTASMLKVNMRGLPVTEKKRPKINLSILDIRQFPPL
jgi:hypothetical protein